MSPHSRNLLVSADVSRALDDEARADWGFNTYALIEAAGRSCARVFAAAYPDFFPGESASGRSFGRVHKKITVAAGAGNNGADAMVMLRYWLLNGFVESADAAVVMTRMPVNDDSGPWVDLLRSLKKMKVPVLVWDGDPGESAGRASDDVLARSDIIVDGIGGTGLKGALRGTALEMVNSINSHRAGSETSSNSSFLTPHSSFLNLPLVVSVDIPSGVSDQWEPGMPVVDADLTLAIEPRKYCMYTPAARPHAGIILPVSGIFPEGIISRIKAAELLEWESVRERVPRIRPDAYKNERGAVEIWAGSPGATGAALIAARGAQAAGAGLVRLMADRDIYPILASRAGGVMVFPLGEDHDTGGRLGSSPSDAMALGPGWGLGAGRMAVLEQALAREENGTPLVLDADAIELARDKVFHGNAILTPHPGEFSRYSGVDKEELLHRPVPVLLKYARERKAVIILKGHVITIAAPDGRIGVVDGMTPGLAAGGSGDLLAGFCAAIAARMVRGRFDGYTCAAAAASLLIAAGKSEGMRTRFTDPLEIAGRAADLAGEAWLGAERSFNGR